MSTAALDRVQERRDALERAGKRWRAAAKRADDARDVRDAAIRAAHDAGLGVRDIARVVGVDPTQVSRVLSR